MKYFDKNGEGHILIARKQPFRELENYFADDMLYQDAHETSEEPAKKSYDSGNEANSKPEPNENDDFEYKINPFVIDNR